MDQLGGVNVPVNPELCAVANAPITPANEAMVATLQTWVRADRMDFVRAVQRAYEAQLGHYTWMAGALGASKAALVGCMNDWARQTGLEEQPGVPATAAGKMKLLGVDGVRVVKDSRGRKGRAGKRRQQPYRSYDRPAAGGRTDGHRGGRRRDSRRNLQGRLDRVLKN
jgi:hypothetical protein